jgi:hypothetical protein
MAEEGIIFGIKKIILAYDFKHKKNIRYSAPSLRHDQSGHVST